MTVQKNRQKNLIVGELIGGTALHPKSSLYIKQKYGGQGLINMEECSVTELRRIDHYLANSDEMLLKVVARLEKLDKDKIESNTEYNKRIQRDKIDKLKGMKPHGQFE